MSFEAKLIIVGAVYVCVVVILSCVLGYYAQKDMKRIMAERAASLDSILNKLKEIL